LIWIPDSCACIIECKSPSDPRAKFIQQCRTHDTPAQTYSHNKRFKLEIEEPQREIERKKPEFQRR